MKNFPTLLLVLLATSSYATNPQKTPSTIERVTVYLDGAQIQRRASITAQKGVHELVFHNLSPEINKNSIQVAGLMDATILSMSFTLDYLEKKAHSEDAKKLKTSLEELTLHKNAQENILLGLQQEQQLLENNYRITNDKTLMSLEQFKKISTYYGTRINTIYDERYQIALRLKKLGLEIEHTKRELQKIQGNSKEERGTIKLKIDVPVAARLDLGITYIIRNAGWFPRYDIKAVSTKKPLSMMYKAHIYQQTGCDWKDIKLILSTGDPNTTNSKPIVHPRYLNFVYGNTPIKSPQVVKRSDYKYNPTIKTVRGVIVNENNHPLPGVNIRIDGTSNGTITDFDGAYSIDIKQGDTLSYNFLGFKPQSIPIHATTINVVMEPDLQLLEEVVVIGYSAKTKKFASKRPKLNRFKAKPVAYNTTVTAKQEHITTTNFQITKKHTINSNEEVTIITIDNFEMPADYEHYAAPELNEAVFLTAQLKNWQQYDLLPGEAHIYFKENYAGKTLINPQAITDDLTISLGIDPGVVVQRQQLENFKSTSFSGTTKIIDRGYVISVKNNKSASVNLHIEDQIPVTQNKEIKIENVQFGDAKFDTKKGTLDWQLHLESKKSQKKLFSYRVKYPRNKQINL